MKIYLITLRSPIRISAASITEKLGVFNFRYHCTLFGAVMIFLVRVVLNVTFFVENKRLF